MEVERVQTPKFSEGQQDMKNNFDGVFDNDAVYMEQAGLKLPEEQLRLE